MFVRSAVIIATLALITVIALAAWSAALRSKVAYKTDELSRLNAQLEVKVNERTCELQSELQNRQKVESWLVGYNHVLKSIVEGQPLNTNLTELVRFIERHQPDILGSVLLLDPTGAFLLYAASATLPQEYNDAINGLQIGPNVGSCGSAAYRNEVVIVEDIATDPLWQNFRELASQHNLSACFLIPLRNRDGKVLGTFAFYSRKPRSPSSEEIIELKRYTMIAELAITDDYARQEIRLKERRYRALVEQAADAIFVYELEGNLVDVNQKACESLQFSREELLRLNIRDLAVGGPLMDLKSVWLTLKAYQSTMIEGVHRRRDGSTFPVEIQVGLIDQNPPFVLVLARDISMRKRMDEQILKIQKLESVGLLAGGIAHDFNNLLTIILANISLLRRQTSGADPRYATLDAVEAAVKRTSKLTSQLLTFSKGGLPVKKAVSIDDLIRETAVFALRGSRSKCNLHLELQGIILLADEGQISQVIQNIVMNADQSMPKGGVIDIRSSFYLARADDFPMLKGSNYAKISVSDQGVGIQPDQLSRIFDPYFTTKEKGHGLGLAVCFSIIKGHNGLITVDSVPEGGTTFNVFIPYFPTEKPVSGSNGVTGISNGRHGKVLVMDDDSMVRETTVGILRGAGYVVSEAGDGREAIELCSRAETEGKPFELVVLDLTVQGGMGGEETNRRLRSQSPSIRTIVASGYSSDPVMANYRQHGFNARVAKPFTMEEMIQAVEDALSINCGA